MKEKIKKIAASTTTWLKGLFLSLYRKCKKISNKIYNWIGMDGLLNLETCTVLVCLFSVLVDEVGSAIFTMIIAVVKTSVDRVHQHEGELHDFICCLTGVILGMIIVSLIGLFRIF